MIPALQKRTGGNPRKMSEDNPIIRHSSQRLVQEVRLRKSGFSGLEVACWPLVPKFEGFAPGRSRPIFGTKKFLSTPPFGGEVKPPVPSRSFTACKRSLNATWKSAFRQNLPDISLPTVPPSAAGCSRGLTRVETPCGESWNILPRSHNKP